MKNEKLPKTIETKLTKAEKRKKAFQEIEDYKWLQFCRTVEPVLVEFCNKRSFDNNLKDLSNSDTHQNDEFFSDETYQKSLSKTFTCGTSWSLGDTRYDYNEKRYESINLPEVETELMVLDKILELYWEDITYLKYRELNRILVSKINGGKTGYGYESRIGTKLFYLFELFQYLEQCEKL